MKIISSFKAHFGTLGNEVRRLNAEIVDTIESARVLSSPLSSRFTSRFGKMSQPVPIREDTEDGA